MKIHEYQAREILQGYGIPFPVARVVMTAEEAEVATRELGGSVVVKAQALVGGRGQGRGHQEGDHSGRGPGGLRRHPGCAPQGQTGP